MANYHTPTVIQPTIPDVDMTPLERLLLSHIFSAEPDGDGLYFYKNILLSTYRLPDYHLRITQIK